MATCQGFLQCVLKVLNFFLAMVGAGMVLYSLWMLHTYYKESPSLSPALALVESYLFIGTEGAITENYDICKVGLSNRKQQQQLDASKCEAARAKRMAELMRQLGTALRQTTQHKWTWPFMEPVNVKGLGLKDYFEIIKKPMDLGTIRDRMDAKDGASYKHIQEICSKLTFRVIDMGRY